jgi:hypothetical protein
MQADTVYGPLFDQEFRRWDPSSRYTLKETNHKCDQDVKTAASPAVCSGRYKLCTTQRWSNKQLHVDDTAVSCGDILMEKFNIFKCRLTACRC